MWYPHEKKFVKPKHNARDVDNDKHSMTFRIATHELMIYDRMSLQNPLPDTFNQRGILLNECQPSVFRQRAGLTQPNVSKCF